MSVKDVVVERIRQLCAQRGIKANELANISGVTPSTVYSLLDRRRRDVSIITIKKLCDGLDITLGEFFSAPEFDQLEQEMKRFYNKWWGSEAERLSYTQHLLLLGKKSRA